MDLLRPGEPWVNVQYLLECFDRPVGNGWGGERERGRQGQGQAKGSTFV